MERVIILGAGGRDFHNFNTFFRDNRSYRVVAFTAAQIPFTGDRVYPPELAGKLYPDGIPVYPEERLESIIRGHSATLAVFAYSDVSYVEVMQRASRVLALGADFLLLGPDKTMLRSGPPVISVCAVRTGCGKSVITRKIARVLKGKGIKVSVVRHPMAYCDFEPAKRFVTMADIDRGACTIEEREEFEHLVTAGITVYAGTDYGKVLEEAEKESQIILWDGGNNDFPFVAPDLEIVLVDALRPGHEALFHPGEVNLRRGNIVIITKVNEAKKEDVEKMREVIVGINPDARVMVAPSVLSLNDHGLAKGKKALVIEDGPTITHGGMPHGAGLSASREIVSEFVDPRPYAVGSLRNVYEWFPHIGPVLPAMGYSPVQIRELEETISRTPAEVVIVATPVDLKRLIEIEKPAIRVSYDFEIDLEGIVDSFLEKHAL